MKLRGKLALITGAGQGVGATLAIGLAAEGAKIICTDIDVAKAQQTAGEIITAGGIAFSYLLDVTNADACVDLAEQLGKSHGDIDLLLNNAGICPRNSIDSDDVRESWKLGIDVNLNGTLNVTLAFVPALRRSKGNIINMASIASFVSTATSISYSTSKAGIKMLTQNLAAELAKDGVRVNAIAPGTLKTAMTEATRNVPERREAFLARIPMRRFGEPSEIVGPAVFLASDMATYVTGTTLVVDGGYLAT